MQSLCTHLPDLPAAGEAHTFRFNNGTRSCWAYECDLGDLYGAFNRAGIPYTVQCRPALEPSSYDSRSWEDSCLTAQERNPLLCR